MRGSLKTVRRRALERVRAQYEYAAGMSELSLQSVNRVRPPSMQYRSINELVREWLAAAGAVCTFAVNIGVITPQEALQIIRDFQAAHPDMVDE